MFKIVRKGIIPLIFIAIAITAICIIYASMGQPRLIISSDGAFNAFRDKTAKDLADVLEKEFNSKANVIPKEVTELYKAHKYDLVEILLVELYKNPPLANQINKSITDLIWGIPSPGPGCTKMQESIQKIVDEFTHVKTTITYEVIQSIYELDLSDFKLSRVPDGALGIFRGVKRLLLNNTGITGGLEALKCMQSLSELEAKSNKLAVLPDFFEFPKLKKVNLNENCFTVIDLTGLRKNEKLEWLSLKPGNAQVKGNFTDVFPNAVLLYS